MLDAVRLPEEASPQEKYIFKPFPGSSHHWAMSQLSPKAMGLRILDIGAGGGGMGQRLRPLGVSTLVAVEIDSRARSELHGIYDQVHESISALRGAQFDAILMLDVLEHMADPFTFLKQVELLLAPRGEMLVSVPNVAHWSVRFPLFFLGRFEYASRGLLDRTHLQLFTRRRFLELLSNASRCGVESVSSSIEPVEILLSPKVSDSAAFKVLGRLRLKIAHVLPGLMAYQHLAVIKRAM